MPRPSDNSRTSPGWRSYWLADRLQSCVAEDAATEMEIAERWIARFAKLADGSRILDVATGNGVLLAHAAVAAERTGRRFELTGIDLAEIDPARYVPDHPAVRHGAMFLGGVDAAELPFDAAAMDVVVSQFGLEYADVGVALDELERVLAQGGRLLWLAHSEGSAVVAQNSDQEKQVALLLADAGPLRAMRDFVGAFAARQPLDRVADRLRLSLQHAEEFCRSHPPAEIAWNVCSVIADTAQNAHRYRPEDLLQMLDDSTAKLESHRFRINDMNAAVLRDVRKRHVQNRLLAPPWMDAKWTSWCVGHDETPIGILFEATRGAAR